jgi:hypothetical protein
MATNKSNKTVGVIILLIIAFIVATMIMNKETGNKITAILPADTPVYLRLSNFREWHQEMKKSGVQEELFGNMIDARVLPEEGIREFDSFLQKIRTLHLSIHKVSVERDMDIDILLIAEGEFVGGLSQWLPKSIMNITEKGGTYGDVQLWQIGNRGMRRSGVSVFLAVSKEKVYVSSKRMLLENILDGVSEGRKPSLADSENFKKVTKGMEGMDNLVYASRSGIINLIEPNLSRRDRREFSSIKEVFSEVKSACAAGNYWAKASTVRVLMEKEGDVFKLLSSQPEKVMKLPEFVPEEAVFAISASIGNPEEIRNRVNEYLSSILYRVGAIRNKDEYFKDIKKGEDQLGLTIKKAVSHVSSEAGFFFTKADDDDMGFFFEIKDEYNADKFMDMFADKAMSREKRVEREVEGEQVRSIGRDRRGINWVITDNCALIAPKFSTIEESIKAYKNKKSLNQSAQYKKVRGLLPASSMGMGYANIGTLFKREFRGMFQTFPQFSDLVIMFSVAANDGLVDITIAHNKEKDELLALRKD